MSEMDKEVEAALKPLTDRERQFCIEYAALPNPHHAALQAGYSDKSARSQGHQLLKRPKIRHAVNLCREKNELKAGVSQEDTLRKLKSIVDRCMQTEPVLDYQGNPTGEYRFDAKNALNAIDIMNKMGGHYAPKKLDVDSTINFIQIFGDEDD